MTTATRLAPPTVADDAPVPRRRLRRPIAGAAVVATAFALLVPGTPLRSVGVAVALVVAVLAAGATVEGGRRARLLALAAAAFVPWLAIRQSPWLIWLDAAAGTVLLVVALTTPPGGSLLAPARRYLARWSAGVRSVPGGATGIYEVALDAADRRAVPPDRARRAVTALAAGFAALVVVLAVLASGDALLASFLDLGWIWSTTAGRIGAASFGAALFVVVVGFGTTRREERALVPIRQWHPLTAAAVLWGLGLAITAHAATQASAALLGAEFVERRTGLTYADYARSGFFQLVAVAAVASIAVATARPVARGTHGLRPGLVIASVAVTTGVVALVASSVVKLVVYADRFGLTMLRVYTVLFAVWIGLVALMTLVAFVRPGRGWLVPAVGVTALVGVFTMNVVDPERLVAEHNLDRAVAGSSLDLDYLDRLSLDAAPAVLERLDELPADLRAAAAARWCRPVDAPGGLASSRSVDAAADAQRRYCRP